MRLGNSHSQFAALLSRVIASPSGKRAFSNTALVVTFMRQLISPLFGVFRDRLKCYCICARSSLVLGTDGDQWQTANWHVEPVGCRRQTNKWQTVFGAITFQAICWLWRQLRGWDKCVFLGNSNLAFSPKINKEIPKMVMLPHLLHAVSGVMSFNSCDIHCTVLG